MYSRKVKVKIDSKFLIPTKATLFGLDVRFRAIDQKLEEDKKKRSAFKNMGKKKKGGINNSQGDIDQEEQVANRHSLPVPQKYLSIERQQQQQLFKAGRANNQDNDTLNQTMYSKSQSKNKTQMGDTFQSKKTGNGYTELDEIKHKMMYATANGGFNLVMDQSILISPRQINIESRKKLGDNLQTYLSTDASQQNDLSPSKLPLIDSNNLNVMNSRNITNNGLNFQNSSIGISKDFTTHSTQLGGFGNTKNANGVVVTSLKSKSFMNRSQNMVQPCNSHLNQTKHNSCFDNLIDKRLNLEVNKNLSFIKGDDSPSKKKILTEKELLEKQQKKLLRSPRDQLIDNTKVQLTQMNNRLKQQAQVEKNIERAKQYNIKNDINGESEGVQGSSNQEEQGIKGYYKPQAIKKAKLFNDEDYLHNLEMIERQAKEIEQEMEQDEEEKKFQYKIRQRVREEQIKKNEIQRIKDQENDSLTQSMSKKSKKINIANLADDDDFLFGETIKIDQPLQALSQNQNKYNQRNQSQPAHYNTTMGIAASGAGQNQNLMMSGQQHQIINDMNGQGHSPLFGKRNMTIQKVKSQHRSLQVTQNIIKKTTLPSQMTQVEKIRLKELVDQEIASYQIQVDKMFSQNKNWSIMISDDMNQARNEAMKRIKFEQLKKRYLPEFMRKIKENFLKERLQLDAILNYDSATNLEQNALVKASTFRPKQQDKDIRFKTQQPQPKLLNHPSAQPSQSNLTLLTNQKSKKGDKNHTNNQNLIKASSNSNKFLQPISENKNAIMNEEQQQEQQEYEKFKDDFIDYMKGIVTKGGTSTLASMGISYGGNQGNLKYKRKKLRMDETVEQIGNNVRNSILQSRQQQQRVGSIEPQSLKHNFRGLQTQKTTQGQTGQQMQQANSNISGL
eukprot:403366532